ncbi:hypothetical protein ACOBQX_29255 [Actinokineospora sp. G85]|uniref:hypothetical protein n=1 Tax=Actinokineospora sp. G85 TaxID=3406626 RepID=UPI003C75A591
MRFRRPGAVWAATAALGLAAVAAGLFLPWLRSGSVLRDSFESLGVIRTLGSLRGTGLAWLPGAWFALVPAVTLCVAAYALGLRRTAATICLFAAIISGTVAVVAAVEAGNGDTPVGIAAAGPTTTATGATLAAIGAVGVLVSGRRGARGRAKGRT